MRGMFGGFTKSKSDWREQAQELAYSAMESVHPRKARELALQAIRLDPNCVDAIMVLAELTSQTKEEFIENVRKAVKAGERGLGSIFFKENRGYFWGLIETRPYMRARAALAEALVTMNQPDEAIAHYEEMLDLNPDDNQGLRFFLLGLYLERVNLTGARRLFKQYKDDGSSVFAWARLLEQLIAGNEVGAQQALVEAQKANRHVAPYLTGRKRPPKEFLDYYSPGQDSEAAVCLNCLGAAWSKHPEAVNWLKRATAK